MFFKAPARMGRFLCEIRRKDGFFINPPPPPPLSPPQPTSSFNRIRISPVILLVITILAIIFFVSGVLHLLVRLLMKRPHFSAIYHSNRFLETSTSHSLHRQLQTLFRQHDAGLDQAFVDALPLFYYKDITGSKEPFDCAVCLCEFTDNDKLRLLPNCSHAFHIDCIDTWLLSNSTCPLCRGTLLSSNFPIENPFSNFESLREISNGFSISSDGGDNGCSNCSKAEEMKRVFSVRLGKFRSLCEGESSRETREEEEESSRCNLGARRCYSMGAVEYVVGDSNLQVALPNVNDDEGGKKIRGRSRGGDSFSVSKTWLWSKKKRFPSFSSTHLMDVSSVTIS
ncbi:RING-H2 finger protein ATL46-like [Euphorbia lathyris]|uniref:RING-H2 finger protein ATL46-like n=1 Tax=Euphorbia lathyris TaxID=212925 RepID=UPI00331323DB